MTSGKQQFSDIAQKRFTVPSKFKSKAILHCLVFERGTRSYGIRLTRAGFDAYDDLDGRTVEEVVRHVPTTRRNLNKVLHYLGGAGVHLT